MTKELPETVRDLATRFLDEAFSAFDEPYAGVASQLVTDTTLGRLAGDYVEALLEGDRRKARELVLNEHARGRAATDLSLHVLLPAQGEIGRMWLANEISVAEEHFGTATTRMVMAQLLATATFKPPNGKVFLAAAAPNNQHDIGLQAVADFFEMDGWRTIYLGANVPVGDLAMAVESFQADLLGLSASQTTQIPQVRKIINLVKQSERGDDVKILLGGYAFNQAPELAKEIGADGYATIPPDAVSIGRTLVGLDSKQRES